MNAMNNGQRPGGENGNDFVEGRRGRRRRRSGIWGQCCETISDDYDDEGEYAMDQYDDEEQYYDDDGIRQSELRPTANGRERKQERLESPKRRRKRRIRRH